jgi:hypothetical protein
MLVDEFLPVRDVPDSAAGVVEAGARPTWDALMDVDRSTSAAGAA